MQSHPTISHSTPDERERSFHWYIVRSQPHQERKLEEIIKQAQESEKNILEVFCPINTTVTVRRRGKDIKAPLYSSHVFVYATFNALRDFLASNYPNGGILYSHINPNDSKEKKAVPLTIPEEDMRAFREFNDSYDEQMVVLDRPYSDYAYNPKSGKMNEVVKIMDGPFAGCKGFFVRFGNERRLVFSILNKAELPYLTISIPNVWSFHVLRLVNGENKKTGSPMERDRATDLLLGAIQCYSETTDSIGFLQDIVRFLINRTSWVELCKFLNSIGERTLSNVLAAFSKDEVSSIYTLVRYEKENPGYVHSIWHRNILRPFLTPTSGLHDDTRQDKILIQHHDFEETIHRVCIDEQVFYPSTQQEKDVTSIYYAHIGKMVSNDGTVILFTNWDKLLSEYFLTADKAELHLLKSFHNYAPTLHHILTDAGAAVKAKENLMIGSHPLCALYVTVNGNDATTGNAAVKQAEDTLLTTALAICREIHTTTHLAIWRRYLASIWLHR